MNKYRIRTNEEQCELELFINKLLLILVKNSIGGIIFIGCEVFILDSKINQFTKTLRRHGS